MADGTGRERAHVDRNEAGYRVTPTGGARVRADVVDLYVFRRSSEGVVELLQLLRTRSPLKSTWQPVMGHVEVGERCVETAVREADEELGLDVRGEACLGLWALEQVYPYFLPDLDCIVMSPRFVAEVRAEWSPTLNDEHEDCRWIAAPLHEGRSAASYFMWPGQKRAIEELLEEIVPRHAPAREHLRV